MENYILEVYFTFILQEVKKIYLTLQNLFYVTGSEGVKKFILYLFYRKLKTLKDASNEIEMTEGKCDGERLYILAICFISFNYLNKFTI